MKEELMVISKKEYDSMKSTLDILADKKMMAQIRTSERNRKKGKMYEIKL